LSGLHHLERVLLLTLKDGKKISSKDLEGRSGLPEASVSRATQWLSSKGYIRVEEKKQTLLTLGFEGERFKEEGFPERILVEAIVESGGRVLLNQASVLSKQNAIDFNIALGWAKKKGWLQISHEDGKIVLTAEKKPDRSLDEKLVDTISNKTTILEKLDSELKTGLNLMKRRPNSIKLTEKNNRLYVISPLGIDFTKNIVKNLEEISQLTPELIKSGNWRNIELRRYNIKAPVNNVWSGKKQPFLRFLDELKYKLVAFGFKEMKGPLVELMFFNFDALYIPQNHPAREIHDIYYVNNHSKGDLSQHVELVNRVKSTHENGWITGSKGWRYQYSIEEAQKLILRSQGTALSARMLINNQLEIPGKYYSISRCYRPDVVDRTHLPEFNQIEGIVLAENLTFCDLLGILEKFAFEIAGAEKVKFCPDYFPFTEPSVELSAYKEDLGWIEFGGAGILRPEVTLPLGVKVPVLAWGLGVNRLFMMKRGIKDIRDLFTKNLDWLRAQRLI